MIRLYVKCPYCTSVFPSGFQAESPTQLIGFLYLCERCRRIFPCSPPDYLEKVDGEFRRAMKKEEIFALPPPQGVLVSGPDLFSLGGEVFIESGKRLGSNRAIVVFRERKTTKVHSSKQEVIQKIRNKELFKLLKDLVNSFMDALDKPFLPDYGSWYDRIKTLVEGNSSIVAEMLLKRPDLKDEKLSRCLVSTEKFLKFVLKEDLSRKPPHTSTREGYQEELTFFLEKLFKEKDRLLREGFYTSDGLRRAFNELLVKEYLKYEAYLYDDYVSDFLICPLENFVGSTKIDLGHLLTIRKITQDEFHSLVEAEEKYEGKFPESYPEFVLYIPVEGKPNEHIEPVITALRLLREEKVGLTKVYYGYALPCKPWKVLEAPEESKFVRKPEDALYILSEPENKKLVNLLSLLERTKSVGYLTIAMRRFNFAYRRDRLEDRWIDYFVSLESLYSKSSESTEVTHRIATRVSKALADTFEDRMKLNKKMKKWYGIRSRIVHGTQVSLNQREVQEVGEVVRKSLKWFMNQKEYADHDKIIDELDLRP